MTKKQKTVLYRIIASAILILGISILCKFADVNIWGQVVLYLIPYFVIGYDILRKAFKGILNKQVFDENFLMAIATVGAILLGEFKEGVAVMLFYQIGELFQSCAVGKSRRNIAALMDIRPDYANIIVDGQIEQVDPDDVEIGTEIVVNPGEKVPIDGIITEGNTTLNTSALTGESVPRDAKVGEEVISGCINMTGAIKLKTTKEFGDSTVSKILDLVENSSMKKSRSENFITKFARYYTPAVCYGALALAILPPIVRLIMGMSPDFPDWIIRALTFLVISCPCALVISIPLSFFGGIGCVVQFVLLTVFLLLVYKEKIVTKIANTGMKILHKLHLMKNIEKRQAHLVEVERQYKECAAAIKNNKVAVFKAFIFNLLQRISLICVSVCVYMGVEGNIKRFKEIFNK